MGAPCINDTCSITSKIDPTSRKLEHNVVLADGKGLECVNGLAVKIFGDPPAAGLTNDAYQMLGITPGGDLYAHPKKTAFRSFGSTDAVPIPHNGTLSNNPIDSGGSVTNPYDLEATLVIIGRFRLGYTVPLLGIPQCFSTGAGIEWVPYSGQLTMRFDVDGDSKAVELADPSGVHPRAATPHYKRDWRHFVWVSSIAAGATRVLTAAADYQDDGSDTRFNMITEGAFDPAHPERGFMCNGQVLILPHQTGA